jgi:RNase P subunit RPR2
MKLKCPKCSYFGEVNESLNKTSNNNVQIRGTCVKCDAWIMWVPYKDSTIVKDILLKEVSK